MGDGLPSLSISGGPVVSKWDGVGVSLPIGVSDVVGRVSGLGDVLSGVPESWTAGASSEVWK